MSEKVLFAFGDPDDPGAFDVSPLYGVGRIVGTGLLFQGMPMIRYDTGDIATLVEAATERNNFHV